MVLSLQSSLQSPFSGGIACLSLPCNHNGKENKKITLVILNYHCNCIFQCQKSVGFLNLLSLSLLLNFKKMFSGLLFSLLFLFCLTVNPSSRLDVVMPICVPGSSQLAGHGFRNSRYEGEVTSDVVGLIHWCHLHSHRENCRQDVVRRASHRSHHRHEKKVEAQRGSERAEITTGKLQTVQALRKAREGERTPGVMSSHCRRQ